MEYLSGAKGTHPDDCFLCEILGRRDDRADLVLRRTKHAVLLLNRYPYSSGHLLVAPARHVDALLALDKDEMLDLMGCVNTGIEALGRALQPGGYNLGVNLGAAAGAGLKGHLHLHIVPRWIGDTNFMPVLADVKVLPQALEALRDQLVNALA